MPVYAHSPAPALRTREASALRQLTGGRAVEEALDFLRSSPGRKRRLVQRKVHASAAEKAKGLPRGRGSRLGFLESEKAAVRSKSSTVRVSGA